MPKYYGPGPYARQGTPTEKLRSAFEASGISKNELCRRLEWVKTSARESGDQRRLNRVLGYSDAVSTKRLCDGTIVEYRSKQKMTSYSTATKIVRALDLDPRDFDL